MRGGGRMEVTVLAGLGVGACAREPGGAADLHRIYQLACWGGDCHEMGHAAVLWPTLRNAALTWYGSSFADPRFVQFGIQGDTSGVDDDR